MAAPAFLNSVRPDSALVFVVAHTSMAVRPATRGRACRRLHGPLREETLPQEGGNRKNQPYGRSIGLA